MSKIGNTGSSLILPAKYSDPRSRGTNIILPDAGVWTNTGIESITNTNLGIGNVNLDNSNGPITFNGVTVDPTYQYYGGDATATSWPAWDYGEDLGVVQLNANSEYNKETTLYGIKNKAVTPASTQYYNNTDTSYGNLGTDEFFLRYIFKTRDLSIGAQGLMRNGGYSVSGLYPFINPTNGKAYMYLTGGSAYHAYPYVVSLASAAIFQSYAYYDLLFYVKVGVSYGGVCCVDGVYSNHASIPAIGSLDNSSWFTLAVSGAGYFYGGDFIYAAQWQLPNWSNGIADADRPAAVAEVAAELYASLAQPNDQLQVLSTAGANQGIYTVLEMGINTITFTESVDPTESDVYIKDTTRVLDESSVLIGNPEPIVESLGAWVSNGTATLTKSDLGLANLNIDNLPDSITFNGLTVNPTCRYYGGDALEDALPYLGYGKDLVRSGTFTASFSQPSPIYGIKNKCLERITGGGHYTEPTDTTFGDLGTDEFIMRLVFKNKGAFAQYFSKFTYSAGYLTSGYATLAHSNTNLYLYYHYGTGTDTKLFVIRPSMVNGTYYDIFLYSKQNTAYGFLVYIDGSYYNYGTNYMDVSLDSSSPLYLGRSHYYSNNTDDLLLAEIYQAPNWSSGLSDVEKIAELGEVAASLHASLLKPANLVQIISATTGADLGFYRVISMGINSITLDRPLSGSDTNVYINAYKDNLLIRGTDGTCGQILTDYSNQNKGIQLGGTVPVDFSQSNTSGDHVGVAGKTEVQDTYIIPSGYIGLETHKIGNEYNDVSYDEDVSIELPSGYVIKLETESILLDDDGATEKAHYNVGGLFYNSGGGATKKGDASGYTTLTDPSYIVTLETDGDNVKIVGAGTNAYWVHHYSYKFLMV